MHLIRRQNANIGDTAIPCDTTQVDLALAHGCPNFSSLHNFLVAEFSIIESGHSISPSFTYGIQVREF